MAQRKVRKEGWRDKKEGFVSVLLGDSLFV